MKILAIDNQISKRVTDKLSIYFKVVMWAGDKPDEIWVEEALDLGANIFISPDLDIPNMLEKLESDAIWIDVPQGMPSNEQYIYLNKILKNITRSQLGLK